MAKQVFKKPEALTDNQMHYCPGCTHGIIHRLVAESMDELGERESAVGVAPVGCAVLAYNYFNCDMQQAAHGRAPAVATGIKRVHPESLVFTYQGDGDLASIGTAEIVHAAARGENISVIFVNNAIYGMTGGQMAPTTLEGQKTTTSQAGRDLNIAGFPIQTSEMLATLDGASYITRQTVHNVGGVQKTKKAIKKAFEIQMNKQGFSMIEILSNCPTNWGMSPKESIQWINDNMVPNYPLGDVKTPKEVE
ncbi:thiamine pyrophosphate-dependent enzyme [Natranaerobius thermophilus]|uniref:Thiamine pyrophosphate protein domain protein TPP-binding n=1 Tax=Natranaerobius thermophilus (strain ATCC BAA-1301 / DSM 18059 / JW/NM-WN-LF) TaxID=457570 RepID=B2A508_NATTJ|nr:thiamine pyrophosphate-dependent enzyme [Natranaerobius thermophilus]ACB85250.1 thiamine pyrophosphate protein domain protein TPP-binding [Natranaerobius thermophilus JW/NM-WN-LF]